MKPVDIEGEYTNEEVVSALRGEQGTRSLSYRYERLDHNNQFVEDIDYITSGRVENNMLADIKRTAKFTALDTGGMDFLKDRIKPYARLDMPSERTYESYVAELEPVLWWKFDDPAKTLPNFSVAIVDSVLANHQTVETAYELGEGKGSVTSNFTGAKTFWSKAYYEERSSLLFSVVAGIYNPIVYDDVEATLDVYYSIDGEFSEDGYLFTCDLAEINERLLASPRPGTYFMKTTLFSSDNCYFESGFDSISVVSDSSGNGISGVTGGTQGKPGFVGEGVGSLEVVNTTESEYTKTLDEVTPLVDSTFSFWLKPTRPEASDFRISALNGAHSLGFEFGEVTNGTRVVTVLGWYISGFETTFEMPGAAPTLITQTVSSEGYSLYVNGELNFSRSEPFTTLEMVGPFEFFASPEPVRVDDLTVFNYAQTAAQVYTLYTLGVDYETTEVIQSVSKTNYYTNPSFETVGALTETRRNFITRPVADISTTPYTYTPATGEVVSSAVLTTAGDGPSGRTVPFVRRTVTTARTGGVSQVNYDQNIPLLANTNYSYGMWVRISVAVSSTSNFHVDYIGGGAGTTTGGPFVAGVWKYLNYSMSKTADFTVRQIFLRISQTLPVGTTIDMTNVIATTGTSVPYFDGSFVAPEGKQYSWAGTPFQSVSILKESTIAGLDPIATPVEAISSTEWADTGLRSLLLKPQAGATSWSNANVTLSTSLDVTKTYSASVMVNQKELRVGTGTLYSGGIGFKYRYESSPGVFATYAGGVAAAANAVGTRRSTCTQIKVNPAHSNPSDLKIVLYAGAPYSDLGENKIYFDSLIITETNSTSLLPYFDGDSEDSTFGAYSWTGTPHASTSVFGDVETMVVPRKNRRGYVEWPLGVFLPVTPGRTLREGSLVVRDIEAYDQLLILRDNKVENRYSVPAGVTYTDAVGSMLGLPRTDTVRSNSLDPVWANLYGGVEVSQEQVRIPIGPGATFSGFNTKYNNALRRASLTARVFPSLGATHESFMQVLMDSANLIEIIYSGGNIFFRHRINDVNSDISIPYNATTMAYWRIYEAWGTIVWQTSPDGSTWTTRRTAPHTYSNGVQVAYSFIAWSWATTTPTSTRVESISLVSSIANNVTPSNTTLPATLEWEPGTSYLEIINELLGAINYESAWFDEDGVFIGTPYVSPADRSPEYIYATDETSVITGDVDQTIDLFDIPNKWILAVSEPDRPPLVGTYINSSPNSPTSTVSRGRTIVDFRTEEKSADQATLTAKAKILGDKASQVYEIIEFSTAAMPIHSNSDTYIIQVTGLAVDSKFTEHTWSLDLSPTGNMKHKARRVVTLL